MGGKTFHPATFLRVLDDQLCIVLRFHADKNPRIKP